MVLHSTIHIDRVQIESSSKVCLFSLCSIAVSEKCLKCRLAIFEKYIFLFSVIK